MWKHLSKNCHLIMVDWLVSPCEPGSCIVGAITPGRIWSQSKLGRGGARLRAINRPLTKRSGAVAPSWNRETGAPGKPKHVVKVNCEAMFRVSIVEVAASQWWRRLSSWTRRPFGLGWWRTADPDWGYFQAVEKDLWGTSEPNQHVFCEGDRVWRLGGSLTHIPGRDVFDVVKMLLSSKVTVVDEICHEILKVLDIVGLS